MLKPVPCIAFDDDSGVIVATSFDGRVHFKSALNDWPTLQDVCQIGERPILRSGTVIYRDCVIGDDFQTGHNVVIREGCRIGNGTHVWSGSYIGADCVIGNRVTVHMNATLASGMVLHDDVFIASNAVFANDRYPPSNTLEPVTIGKGARVGVAVSVLPGVHIGAHAMIGSGTVVVRDVPEYAIVLGNPGRVVGDVRSQPKTEAEQIDREVDEAYAGTAGSGSG